MHERARGGGKEGYKKKEYGKRALFEQGYRGHDSREKEEENRE